MIIAETLNASVTRHVVKSVHGLDVELGRMLDMMNVKSAGRLQIELEIEGAETELDRSMVEKLNDPLMHIVRNAMDHGIESVEVRKARGKPAQGTIKLTAYHDSGNIVIGIHDDGGGLDVEKYLRRQVTACEWSLWRTSMAQNLIHGVGESLSAVVKATKKTRAPRCVYGRKDSADSELQILKPKECQWWDYYVNNYLMLEDSSMLISCWRTLPCSKVSE